MSDKDLSNKFDDLIEYFNCLEKLINDKDPKNNPDIRKINKEIVININKVLFEIYSIYGKNGDESLRMLNEDPIKTFLIKNINNIVLFIEIYDCTFRTKIDYEMRVIRSSLQFLVEYGPSEINLQLRNSIKTLDSFFQICPNRLVNLYEIDIPITHIWWFL